jgi:outer membrane cobalamin receptor
MKIVSTLGALLALIPGTLAAQDAIQADSSAQSPPALAVADTIVVQGSRVPIADITRNDVMNMTYADLANLPLEALMAIADKLEISVEDLLNMKMTVSSQAATTLREQPGIVSVVTGEDIRASGARDLVDVLRTVPGIFVAGDIGGIVGLGMRGNWAHEGKVLLLIDGQTMNELRYSGIPLDHHFPVDNIERIEIIRGPGSSVYGGFAELGVINIITKKGRDINGVSVGGAFGAIPSVEGLRTDAVAPLTVGRAEGSMSAGAQLKDFEFSMYGWGGGGHRSDRMYSPLQLRDRAQGGTEQVSEPLSDTLGVISGGTANVGVRYKDLKARFLFDSYSVWAVEDAPYQNEFRTWCGELSYDWKLAGGKLTLTPKYNIKWDIPWYTDGYSDNERMVRSNAGVSAVWETARWLTLTAGVEEQIDDISIIREPFDTALEAPGDTFWTYDTVWSVDHSAWAVDSGFGLDTLAPEDTLLFNGERSVVFYNTIGYLQALLRAPSVGLSLTAGMRLEHHSQYGWAFAPRVALNQVHGRLHYKLLYNRSFRAPTIGSIEDNVDIKPEATDVVELELGWKISKNLFVTCNAFDITIHDPIIYWDSDTGGSGYVNGTQLGSLGAELELAARFRRAALTASYSYYHTSGKPLGAEAQQYIEGAPGGSYYAAPQHKLVLGASVRPLERWTVSPTVIVYSSSYSTSRIDEEGNPVGVKIDPAVLLNLYTSYAWRMGLRVGLGVYDIFDTGYPFAQAYVGSGGSLPSAGTEICLRVDYDFKLKR